MVPCTGRVPVTVTVPRAEVEGLAAGAGEVAGEARDDDRY